MNNQGDFNFTWIFAILAGIAILVLAIYGAVKIGEALKQQSSTETAKEITILTDPLQAGFAEGKFGVIRFNKETKINNYCSPDDFGSNEISVSVFSKGVWGEMSVPISVKNKYIFSSDAEGKEYYVFSKPFNFPYEIADLIFVNSKKYCFVKPPYNIEDDVLGLVMDNIEVGNCLEDSVSVCFESSNCKINVYGIDDDFNEGYVEKDGERLYFVGNLIYGAIFADRGLYECNVERLLYRDWKIAEVFAEKADLMNGRGVDTNLKADLILWGGLVKDGQASDLISLNQIAKELDKKNEGEKRGVGGIW